MTFGHAVLSLAAASTGAGDIHIAWTIPFALLLLTIAILPLIRRHFWEHHYPKIAAAFAVIPTIYYFLIAKSPGPWLMAMEEYASFILLLASLYIVSGGIVIRVNRKATPLNNCGLLAIGAVLANIFGTTGASMLLIRPFLHMNRGHLKPFHVVFFIFIVSNCGGLLTPIGDPPLFLGYLQGIPFSWTLENLWPIWAVSNALLLAVFFIRDTIDHRAIGRDNHPGGPQVHILGIHNVLFIALVVFAVFRPGFFAAAHRMFDEGPTWALVGDVVFSRELLMAAAGALSMVVTPRDVYKRNEFTYGPIKEVAILFVAIFSTMTPALSYLENNASKLQVRTPGELYYASGTLSAFLDNAPTYLTFLRTRQAELDRDRVRQAQEIIADMHRTGQLTLSESVTDTQVRRAVGTTVAEHLDMIRAGTVTPDHVRTAFLIGNPELNILVIAISAGAVLFGACTYIGNGPNFMVKSIADSHGVPMPSFLSYIFRYSLPVLVPMYVLIWYVFLR